MYISSLAQPTAMLAVAVFGPRSYEGVPVNAIAELQGLPSTFVNCLFVGAGVFCFHPSIVVCFLTARREETKSSFPSSPTFQRATL